MTERGGGYKVGQGTGPADPSTPQERQGKGITMDVVIPIYNEEAVLDPLIEELEAVFAPEVLKEKNIRSVRYVVIDDGSKDQSAHIIASHIARGLPAILYRLSRNFGHQNAVSAGLQFSHADVVAIIDADLQDPPGLIFQMLERWREGYDVVYGQRKRRKENPLKVICCWLFYRILAFLSEIDTPLDSGDFCLLDRKAVQAIRTLPEKLRFPRGLRSWVGFKQTGLRYERPRRRAGKSKYSFRKLYHLATDGIASSSIRPLQVTQFLSFCFLILTAIFVFVFIRRFMLYSEMDEMGLWFFMTYLLIALAAFAQTLCLYILSAYVGRTYLEVKGRPPYFVMEIIRGSHELPNEGEQGECGNIQR